MPAPRKYPNELRERSVRLVSQMRQEQPQESHRAISTVAKRLDVHPATLRLWVNQAEVDKGTRAGTTAVDSARIAELERENCELRRANEIPKAASAFMPTWRLCRQPVMLVGVVAGQGGVAAGETVGIIPGVVVDAPYSRSGREDQTCRRDEPGARADRWPSTGQVRGYLFTRSRRPTSTCSC